MKEGTEIADILRKLWKVRSLLLNRKGVNCLPFLIHTQEEFDCHKLQPREKLSTTHKGNMAQKLTVKVCLNLADKRKEIRRFLFQKADSKNYSSLERQIEELFPIIERRSYKLFWRGKFNLVCVVLPLK